MRRRGAVLVAVSVLAAALTAGTGTAATADPPPLDAVVLTAKQAGPGYTRYTMDGGRQVNGQVTLDFCGGGYPSEALRQRRFQTIYANPAGAAQLSNEVVRYSPGGATAGAPGGRPPGADVPANGGAEPCSRPRRRAVPLGRAHPRSRAAGRLGGDQDDGRGDGGRPQGATRDHRHLPAARQLPLRRLCLGRHRSIEARERACAPPTQAPTTCCAAIS